jgi:signal transduction histidine kinase
LEVLTPDRPLLRQALPELLIAEVVVLAAASALAAVVVQQRRYAAWLAEQQGRTAVADERVRIARDLHDVIAHSLTVITAKAGVTNYLIESHPDQVRDALTTIEKTGREALTEMRRVLGVLRADQPAPQTAPGLSDLHDLAAQAAAVGVDTRLEVRGERPLQQALSLLAYRIVQEAVTNVVKHAAPARCTVVVDITDDRVDIQVHDDGHGAPASAGGGHGIIGMRERVTAFGGTFAAGPQPHGGWLVTAHLPITRDTG